MEPTFSSELDVQLIDFMGGDQRLCQAARVSTQGAASLASTEAAGLIRYLITNRHGSPLEHSVFTFLLDVPTVVIWQLVRHRIASYNIESGRYRTLQPRFYLPPRSRKLVQQGKPGHYDFVEGTEGQHSLVEAVLRQSGRTWWREYQELLEAGIANEVARLALPFHLFWSAYVTINARSLMNFLSLRTSPLEHSAVASFPQAEIAVVAELMEHHFAEQMPLTWQAWDQNGRQAP